MIIAATGCLIYYAILRIATKRWNSTFAVFWFITGILCMGLQIIRTSYPQWVKNLQFEWILLPAVFFIVVELCVLMYMRPAKEADLSALIVLGAQVQGRKITDSLMRRLDCACTYLKAHKETVVIVSGGQGKGEDVTEAEAMEGFLVVRGIERNRITREDKSTSTKENLMYSAALLKDKSDPVGIVTNNFHMFRAVKLGRQAGLTNLHRIPAECSPIFIVNYMVREFFAIIKMWIVR